MTDADLPFLAAIRAAPGDPQPHTVYADWLFDQPGRAPEAALRYVLLEPGDDSYRLAYADRLEDLAGLVECSGCNGSGHFVTGLPTVRVADCPRCRGTGQVSDGRRDRGEFIRVQCELSRYDAMTFADCPECEAPGEGWAHADDCPRSPKHPLRRRERELLTAANALAWGPDSALWAAGLKTPFQTLNFAPDLLPGYTGVLFSRGFVSALTLTAADLLAHAAQIFAAAPVERVVLSDRRPSDFGEEHDTVYGRRCRWRWYTSSRWEREDNHILPAALFDQLAGSGRWKNTYPTAEAALADLSAAAISWGRQQAGLPAWGPAGVRAGA